MKAHIANQAFRFPPTMVTLARISSLGAESATEEKIRITFYATHWCKKETQMIIPEGETEPVETEVEIATPLATPNIVDESIHVIPFELWAALRTSVSTPAYLPSINEALAGFNPLFTNSMAGFNLEVSTIEMG